MRKQTLEPIYKLYNTFATDLALINCHVGLEDHVLNLPTRSYYKGYVCYKGEHVPARLIRFKSGNIRVSSISGSLSSELIAAIDAVHKDRGFLPLARQLYGYLYIIASPVCAAFSLLLLSSGRILPAVISLGVMLFLRLAYIYTRNHF